MWLPTAVIQGPTELQTPGPHPEPPTGNIWRWSQGICIFKKLLRWRETAAFPPALCFLLKLFPFFFGELIGNHSTFVHITPESLTPRLLSQTADGQHPINTRYLLIISMRISRGSKHPEPKHHLPLKISFLGAPFLSLGQPYWFRNASTHPPFSSSCPRPHRVYPKFLWIYSLHSDPCFQLSHSPCHV